MENTFDDLEFEYKGETYFVNFTASYTEKSFRYNHNTPIGEDMGPDEYELEFDDVYDIDVSREGEDGFYDLWEDWEDDKDFAASLYKFCEEVAKEWDGE